jgi:2-polyprenyl-3-methyl-5-hydroxy-6-metoxy-1,4-benzoquinol methylase
MINRLHSMLHRPEKGWDPVPRDHAEWYAEAVWKDAGPENPLVDLLEQRVGGLKGKRVLDLGGGPGQFSVPMAQRGAHVTWHDVSQRYLEIARQHARDAGVAIDFSLGYMEDAAKFLREPFDVVFNLLCWYYSMDDRRFARLVYHLTKPGGACYIEANNSTFEKASGARRLVYLLNRIFWLKIGHPHPPRGRIVALFNNYLIDTMIVDCTFPGVDKVFFIRGKVAEE